MFAGGIVSNAAYAKAINRRATIGDCVDYGAQKSGNNAKTAIKLGLVAGGTYLAAKNPKVINSVAGGVTKFAKGSYSSVFKGLSRLSRNPKAAPLVKKLAKGTAGALKFSRNILSKGIGFISKLPGPVKLVALAASAFIAVKHAHNSGKIDQGFQDRVRLGRVLEA